MTLSKDTILSRFIKSYGSPISSSKGPFIIGSTRQDCGMTMNLQACMELWRNRFIREYNKPSMKPISINPILVLTKQELEYRSQDSDNQLVDCTWPINDLLDGMHILDSKPFQRLEVQYFPPDILPLAISRQVDGEQISVLIAPHVLPVTDHPEPEQEQKKFKGNPWNTGKLKFERVTRLFNSTFWLLESKEKGFEQEMVKCEKCGTEFIKQDYLNRALRDGHPWCICSCNTYDDWCNCIKIRERMIFEKKAREVVKIRHYMSRWQ